MDPKQLLVFAGLPGGLSLICAQSCSLEGSCVAGGGGLSRGAGLALRGVVVLAEAVPRLSGGSFALTGGFPPRVGLVQNPEAPQLRMNRNSDGAVLGTWPGGGGWQPQQCTTTMPDDWSGSPDIVADDGVTRSIWNHSPSGWLFFRLHKTN